MQSRRYALMLAKAAGAKLQRLEADHCGLLYEIDRRARALAAVRIESREARELAAPA